jgi:hypothetical protein
MSAVAYRRHKQSFNLILRQSQSRSCSRTKAPNCGTCLEKICAFRVPRRPSHGEAGATIDRGIRRRKPGKKFGLCQSISTAPTRFRRRPRRARALARFRLECQARRPSGMLIRLAIVDEVDTTDGWRSQKHPRSRTCGESATKLVVVSGPEERRGFGTIPEGVRKRSNPFPFRRFGHREHFNTPAEGFRTVAKRPSDCRGDSRDQLTPPDRPRSSSDVLRREASVRREGDFGCPLFEGNFLPSKGRQTHSRR